MAEDVAAAIRSAAARLSGVGDTPRLDAELLMAHAMGISREALLLGRLQDSAPQDFADLLDRRLRHEPLAYITGSRDFWTISLHVAPGVLIPRPDSETLIEAAIDHFGANRPKRVLDLGTGSGALLLAALTEWPDASGIGIDRSAAALAIASANADRLGLATRAVFRPGDWGDGVDEAFDLLLCNPPYVESMAQLSPDVAGHEPAEALYAGVDGLDDYRRLAPQIGRLIRPGGIAAIEIGADQAAAVQQLLVEQGLGCAVRHDLAGRDRCIVVKH
jgi:release factor glutamine methyltransferase